MHTLKIKQLLYGLIPIIMLLISSGQLFAQSGSDGPIVPFGPEGPGISPYNYLTEKIYSSNTSTSQTTTTYFDGLGRELQTQISFPNHNNIVTLTDYDSYGRVSKKYLPYPNSSQGSFFPTEKEEQQAYYQSKHNSVYGYSQLVYDNTVKNTVIETSLPGDSWRLGGGHTQHTGVRNNTTADNVKKYVLENDTTVVYSQVYAANQLIRNETIDPQGDKVYQYYNIQEQLVAEEVRSTSGSQFTYYLYDDLGLLRYVIPPIADAKFTVGNRKHLTELKPYCFYTEYDNRQRPYKNYIPGAGCTINLYDKKDRLVLSQSEELRKQGKWLFTKYDNHNRPVLSGTCTGTEAQHRAALQSQTVFGEARGTIAHGYTNNTYPTTVANNDYLTATYYDNYDWQGESQETLSVAAWPDTTFVHTVNDKVAGMVTGSKQKIVGIAEDKWLLSASYYDDKYREIQSVRQLYPEGLELIYRKFNYQGNLTRVKELQTIDGRQEGFDRSYTYNIQGYLTEVTQQVLDYGEPLEPVTIAKYTYNDLWQITEKANHNNIDTTHYGYAIDGRQVSAQSPLFSYKLYFDQKPDNLMYSFFPRYDGNISFMEWQNGVSTRGYRYEYDDVKQLQVGSYGTLTNASWGMGKAYGERNITYDLNGNITTLTRTNSAEENLHDINNTYVGNQLASTNINGVGYAYTYDGDGNMVTDGYKGINIAYNILNLPSKIFAGTEEVSYIYSASGQKLATKVEDSYTYYRGSFVYNDGELDHILHPEGIIRKASGGYVYYYAKKDHLGSTRILAYEADGKMKAAQTMDYYPFGLSFRNYGMNFNRYLFSGKELQDQVVNGKQLQLYDFGARNYDPVLGRWFNIDPALQFVNPYTYCANNPVNMIDPDGMWMNPIYDPLGNLLGTDDKGLKGRAIIMKKDDFQQGMRHDDAIKMDLGINKLESKAANNRYEASFASLKDRPDYDGVLTLDEANDWYRNGNRTPLYVDRSKIDLSPLTIEDLKERENEYTNLLTTCRPSVGLVYGNIKIKILNDKTGEVVLGGDKRLDNYGFEMHKEEGIKTKFRNSATVIGGFVAGEGKNFDIRGYGRSFLPLSRPRKK